MDELDPEDFYFDENGLLVFTEAFHRKRGYCCKQGCKHCAWKSERDSEELQKKPDEK